MSFSRYRHCEASPDKNTDRLSQLFEEEISELDELEWNSDDEESQITVSHEDDCDLKTETVSHASADTVMEL